MGAKEVTKGAKKAPAAKKGAKEAQGKGKPAPEVPLYCLHRVTAILQDPKLQCAIPGLKVGDTICLRCRFPNTQGIGRNRRCKKLDTCIIRIAGNRCRVRLQLLGTDCRACPSKFLVDSSACTS